MTLQEEALVALARCLEEHGIPYMIIGGLANAVWGELLSRPEILQNWSRWKAGLDRSKE